MFNFFSLPFWQAVPKEPSGLGPSLREDATDAPKNMQGPFDGLLPVFPGVLDPGLRHE